MAWVQPAWLKRLVIQPHPRPDQTTDSTRQTLTHRRFMEDRVHLSTRVGRLSFIYFALTIWGNVFGEVPHLHPPTTREERHRRSCIEPQLTVLQFGAEKTRRIEPCAMKSKIPFCGKGAKTQPNDINLGHNSITVPERQANHAPLPGRLI